MNTTLDLGQWCVLQMNSLDTLKVVDVLTKRGLLVWTPTEWSVGRMPRTRARFDKPAPMMAGYAFASAQDIDQLYRLAAIRSRDVPPFRFLKSETMANHTPLIADIELACLREREATKRAAFDHSKRKGNKPPKPTVDTEVRLPDGPFGGLNGEVRRTKGRDIVVDIPNCPFTLKVSSLLCLESVAQVVLPDDGRAARAA